MQDFRVETFLTVCRTMNYTRAAKALNITQPAVSQHIAHLEKAYGARLFDYRGKRLTLTEAGELVRSTLSSWTMMSACCARGLLPRFRALAST